MSIALCCGGLVLQSGDITVLMAVPTMYSYLLSYYDSQLSQQQQEAAAAAVANLRLTVSGSAAAPVPLLQRWKSLSGQQLLERYGMTETGMILSNPYKVGLGLDGEGGGCNVAATQCWPALQC
eukprot:GHUV01036076.1.p1 GENE.GHUV01036076.1~~GHUV01036076.1.p1  ORF type:complete len:123 (-),score=47.25 GHUV01036076.1:33-401(-)